MKTKKIIAAILVMTAGFGLSSCNETEESIDWAPMQWTAESEVENVANVDWVSADGAELTFSCENYTAPWFSAGEDYIFPNADDHRSIAGEFFNAQLDGKKLTITFEANYTSTRQISVIVTEGNIFHTFQFAQSVNK